MQPMDAAVFSQKYQLLHINNLDAQDQEPNRQTASTFLLSEIKFDFTSKQQHTQNLAKFHKLKLQLSGLLQSRFKQEHFVLCVAHLIFFLVPKPPHPSPNILHTDNP